MNLDEIKEELLRRWEQPTVGVCLSIINFMASHSAEQLQVMTFRTLTHAAGKISFDEDVLKAVAVLTSSRVALLDAKTLLIDDDDEEYEMELDELAEARSKGQLIHPETGYPVPDFEEKVFPIFIPSLKFRESVP